MATRIVRVSNAFCAARADAKFPTPRSRSVQRVPVSVTSTRLFKTPLSPTSARLARARHADAVTCSATGADAYSSWTTFQPFPAVMPHSQAAGRRVATADEAQPATDASGVTRGQALKAFAEFCGLLAAVAIVIWGSLVGFQPAIAFLESRNEIIAFGSVAVSLFGADRARVVQNFVENLNRRIFTFATYMGAKNWQVNIVACGMRLIGSVARAMLLLLAVDAFVDAIIPDGMMLRVPHALTGILGHEAGSVVTGVQIEAVIDAFAHKVAYALLMTSLGMQLFALKRPPSDSPSLKPEDGVLSRYFLAIQGSLPGREHIRFVGLANLTDRLLDLLISAFVSTRVLGTFGVEFKAIMAVAGVGALAVSFASRPLVQNLISGLHIFITNPFTVGDKIAVTNGITGVVQRIGWTHTLITTEDGLPYTTPNDSLASASLVNKARIDNTKSVVLPVVLSPLKPGADDVQGAMDAIAAVLKAHTHIDSSKSSGVHFKGTVHNGGAVMLNIMFSFENAATSVDRNQKESDILLDVYKAAQKFGLGAVLH